MFSLRRAKMPPVLGMAPSKSLGVFVEAVFGRLGVLVGFRLLEPAGGMSVSTSGIGVELKPSPSVCSVSGADVASDILY